VVEQRAAVLHRGVEQAAVAAGAGRHLRQKGCGQRRHGRGIGIRRGDDPHLRPGFFRRRHHATQRRQRLVRARQSFEPDLDEGVAEPGGARDDPRRRHGAGRTGGGAHRTSGIEAATGLKRGSQNGGAAGTERPATRVLQVDDRGPGPKRGDRLGGIGDAREQERRPPLVRRSAPRVHRAALRVH